MNHRFLSHRPDSPIFSAFDMDTDSPNLNLLRHHAEAPQYGTPPTAGQGYAPPTFSTPPRNQQKGDSNVSVVGGQPCFWDGFASEIS